MLHVAGPAMPRWLTSPRSPSSPSTPRTSGWPTGPCRPAALCLGQTSLNIVSSLTLYLQVHIRDHQVAIRGFLRRVPGGADHPRGDTRPPQGGGVSQPASPESSNLNENHHRAEEKSVIGGGSYISQVLFKYTKRGIRAGERTKFTFSMTL